MLTETASFHMRDHHPMLGWGPHWCPPLLHAQNLHWAACDSAAFWQGEPRIIADWGCKHARLEQHEAAPAGLLVQVQALGCCSDTCMRTLFLALGRRFCLPGPLLLPLLQLLVPGGRLERADEATPIQLPAQTQTVTPSQTRSLRKAPVLCQLADSSSPVAYS